MRLSQFYTTTYIKQALDSYRDSIPRTWDIAHRLDLYEFAKIAFEPDATEEEKPRAFRNIYENLRRYWYVFRNAAGPCWSAEKTFQVLTTECEPCSRQSTITAKNLIVSDSSDIVRTCLANLGPIKPTRRSDSYPWVAVSKFLHFFNPSLFPIYDYEIMWKKVANGMFKQDYRDFCSRHGFYWNEWTARFNLQYTLWASEVMHDADEDCMSVFSQWFASQVGCQFASSSVISDLDRYYAAAFEMIAIGAAHLDV